MKKISRHDSPYGRRHCAVRMQNNTRRERKWLARMFKSRRGFDWRGDHNRWIRYGYTQLAAIELGNA